MTSVCSSIRLEPPQGLLGRAGHDLRAQVEQHQQVAQVAGEERHLVGAGDQHLAGGHDRVDRGLDDRPARACAPCPRRSRDRRPAPPRTRCGRARTAARRRRSTRLARPGGRRRYSSRAACWSSGKPSKPSACEKRTTVLEEVLARRASSSAVWNAASSRWSTMYWATSFCERENSSKRARMYADRAWWPVGGAVAVGAAGCFIGRPSDSTPTASRPSRLLDAASPAGGASTSRCSASPGSPCARPGPGDDVDDQHVGDHADPQEREQQRDRLPSRTWGLAEECRRS